MNRWVSADPLTIHGLGGDLNLYAYVSGRALKATDPLGLEEDHEAQMSFAANATSSDGFATDAGAKTGGAVEVPAPYADPRKTAPVPEPRPGAIAKSAGTGGTGGGEGAGGGSAVRQKSAVDRFQEGEREAIQRELDEAFAKNTENLGFPEAREWADKFWNSEPIPGLGDRIGPEGGKFIATLSLKVELTPLRSQLPAFDGKTTVGALSTPDGGRVWFQSGGADSAYRNYIAAGHVEGQAAIWMRENGISRATLFQNNTNGICGYCDSQVATLLAKDAKLTVISPSGAVPNNSRAVATPKTYTGNSRDPKPAP